MLRLFATGTFLAALATCLNAQPTRFQLYSINEGLSQSSVKCIVQDQTGFVWLATQDGLNRFDGKNFKIWKRRERSRSSLSDNNLSQLVLDTKGNLWIGTLGGGLNIYHPDTDSTSWINHSPDSSKSTNGGDFNGEAIMCTMVDHLGKLWVGTQMESSFAITIATRFSSTHTTRTILTVCRTA